MQYTQQQYKEAIDKAIAVGDRQSAEELAEIAAEIYGPYKEEQFPNLAGAAARETLGREMEEFSPEIQRRFARVAGEDPSVAETVFRAPELAAIGVSQAARAGGATLSSYIGGLLPESVKAGARDLLISLKKLTPSRLPQMRPLKVTSFIKIGR